MPGIFVSYRRDDSAGYAGRIHEALARAFGRELVFVDVDAIAPGADFPAVLDERLARCDVLLALIGRGWSRAAREDGRRRLDAPDDFVRREIAGALGRGIPVIPVLLGGARMPAPAELPEEIRALAYRNALEVPERFFQESMRELVATVAAAGPHVRPRVSRRAVVAAGVASVLGVAALVARELGGGRGSGAAARTEDDALPARVPELPLPKADASPVRVREPADVAEPPPAVAGPVTPTPLTSRVAVGPRAPRVRWAARVSIGHTWRALGTAPDGTVYLWDVEHGTLSGVRDGAERWANRGYLDQPTGLDRSGRLWLGCTDTSGSPRVCCFNGAGEGGRLPPDVRAPPDLRRTPWTGEAVAAYACADGVLRPTAGGWQLDLGGNCGNWDPVSDARGNAYVANDRATLFCVSPAGAVRWRHPIAERAQRPLVVGDDVVIAEPTRLVCIREGRVRWERPMTDPLLYVADRAGTVYPSFKAREKGDPYAMPHVAAVDDAGRLLWQFRTGETGLGPVGIDAEGRLYLGGGGLLVCVAD